jgi:hypothetical protein
MTTKKNIATKLHSIKNGIGGALNSPDIQEKLISSGYIPEKIAQEKIAQGMILYVEKLKIKG